MLEIGQYINDGQRDLLVCEIKQYEGKKYVYLLDEQMDEAYFYEMKKINNLWHFVKETNESQIKQLIIYFSDIKNILKGEKNEVWFGKRFFTSGLSRFY